MGVVCSSIQCGAGDRRLPGLQVDEQDVEAGSDYAQARIKRASEAQTLQRRSVRRRASSSNRSRSQTFRSLTATVSRRNARSASLFPHGPYLTLAVISLSALSSCRVI